MAATGRLTRRAEFLRAAAKGRKAAAAGLVLQKKIGNAVIRNRTRRRLKEAARLVLTEHEVSGVDLVLIGREATRGRDFADLRRDLRRALARVGVA